jgi:hypothetical protein
MPSKKYSSLISDSLATDEKYEDFEYMFETLLDMRRKYQRSNLFSFRRLFGTLYRDEEDTAGLLLCVLISFKPSKYVEAMQEFRLLFRGISLPGGKKYKAIFSNSILPAALALPATHLPDDLNPSQRSAYISENSQIVFEPSLYLNPLPILTAESPHAKLDSLRKWF